MRVLLIFPPTTIFGDDPSVPPVTQPLGLAYLAGYLEREGHDVVLVDGRGKRDQKTRNENSVLYGFTNEDILDEIEKFNPDIVGMSNMWTAYSGDPHRISKAIKVKYPNIFIVFGGSHPSEFPELVLKDKNVDLVVMGEGEITFSEFLMKFEKNESYKDVLGIAFRGDDDTVVRTPARERMEDLDSLPYPARHMLPIDRYLEETRRHEFIMRKPSLSMITSRGCPQKCVFCTVRAVWGRDWSSRSPSNVVDEIVHLQETYGIREVSFMDDDLGRDIPRLHAICDEIINRKVDIKWVPPNGVAHWLLNEELLDKMKAAGCYRVTFGIESGNTEVRKFIKKKVPLEQATRMVKYANKIGMWTVCTFILGFPYETKETMRDSIKYAVDCGTDMAVFYLLMPHPTSDVYATFKEEGLLDLDPIMDPSTYKSDEDFATLGETLSQRGAQTKHCSSEDLQEMLDEAYKTFFTARLKSWILNPMHIFRKVRSFEDLLYTYRVGHALAKPIRNFVSSKKTHINMLWDKYNEEDGYSKPKIHESKTPAKTSC
jgi:anaerobic magnesium-protoporphyrin IX monomethyl ester cyclase